ncbi:GNAT family N-acetyltransferase [Scopulibacillus darangshiensis]|nr:GNAT family N-acetyltransferase [Scopulibacillus darangshiensis]
MIHKGSIWGMYVVQDQAGKGIGRKLLEHVLEHARDLSGLEQVNLCVVTTNVLARNLYLSMGFKPHGSKSGWHVL